MIARERRDLVAAVPGALDDRFPVDGRIALPVQDANGAFDRRQRLERVEIVVEAGRRSESGDGGGFGIDDGGREQRLRCTETVAEDADGEPTVGCPILVFPVARPSNGVSNVLPFTVSVVPGPVIEAHARDSGITQGIGHRDESRIAARPAVSGMRRARGDDRIRRTVRPLERPADVAGAGKNNVGHGWSHTLLANQIDERRTTQQETDCYRSDVFKAGEPYVASMGILSRTSYVIRSKINSVLNRAEDPTETLDYSYEQMRDQLQQVKRGIADLTTQKKRLEMQKRRLEENVEKHNDQARTAVQQDREDLARRALEKKKTKMNQIDDLERQISDLQNQQDSLIEQKNELQTRIEEFRTKKETMKARYEAAEASSTVSEAMTATGEEFEDVGRAIERAEEQTEDMEARAAALDELHESGAFEDVMSDKDNIDRELEELATDSGVEAELETLKSEMGEGESEPEPESDVESGADVDETELADLESGDQEDVEAELAELQDEENT